MFQEIIKYRSEDYIGSPQYFHLFNLQLQSLATTNLNKMFFHNYFQHLNATKAEYGRSNKYPRETQITNNVSRGLVIDNFKKSFAGRRPEMNFS